VSNSVTVVGVEDVLKRLSRLKNVPTKQATRMVSEIAELSIYKILDRTSRGVDVNETAFKPYTPKYALLRQEKGLPVDKVDLTVSGMMLSSITYEANKREARIFFQNVTDRTGTSVPMKAYFLNEQREFFSISESDKKQALEIVERYIERASR
jgi:hypothetical protein